MRSLIEMSHLAGQLRQFSKLSRLQLLQKLTERSAWILSAPICTSSRVLHRVNKKMKATEASSVNKNAVEDGSKRSLIAELLMDEKGEKEQLSVDRHMWDFEEKIKSLEEMLSQLGEEELLHAELSEDFTEEDGSRLDEEAQGECSSEKRHYIEEVVLDEAVGETVVPMDQTRKAVFSGSQEDVELVSSIPCPGCGALLHCRHPGVPGYMLPDKYKAISEERLSEHFCQRCYMLRNYNKALALSLDPGLYAEIISQIRGVTALTILLVDITDIEGSLIKNLPTLIGARRPLFILGNKVDLLPSEERGYLKHVRNVLEGICKREGLYADFYVHYTALISAKTGYGIEDLISRLFKVWSRRGHVYLLGCTNVGKSSLFNMLLSSDYCKATSRDLIHRATTSIWPGTTLNLLKFPIMAPDGAIIQQRVKRLLAERKRKHEEERLREKQTQPMKVLPLHESVGQTILGRKDAILENHHKSVHGYVGGTYMYDAFEGRVKESTVTKDVLRREVFGEKELFDEAVYAESKWCHDTPGLVNPEQVINILTQEELSLVLPRTMLRPRNFVIKPGTVVFLSGLGRLDYFKGSNVIYLTVYACKKLPVHTMPYEMADDFYREHIGTNSFMVPAGGLERLNRLPSLVGREFIIQGNGWKQSSADIVLSSLGWVSVTTGYNVTASVRAYTPGGYGCYLRTPPLLRHGVQQKGHRIRGTSQYKMPGHKKKHQAADEYETF